MKFFPIFHWAPLATRQDLAGDLAAAAITTILLVPQGLAYAMVAGLPPVVGLYASVLPAILYALLGTSRNLSVGPASVAAIMVAAATVHAGSDVDPVAAALILSALSGLILLSMGLLRMGVFANLLSQPVLTGFSSGAAIVIMADQLRHFAGIELPSGLHPHEVVAYLGARAAILNPETLAVGGLALLLLLASAGSTWAGRRLRMLAARLAPVVVLALATGAVVAFGLERVPLVGAITTRPPMLDLEMPGLSTWIDLLPSAALISIIVFVESVSIGKYLAARRRETVDADQELVALGAANLGSALSGAMPVAGSFSRSMVNFNSGARTQFSSIFLALFTAATLLLFAPLFSGLPKAALAAIIIVAVAGLVDLRSIPETWRYSKADGASNLVTFLGVLAYGVEAGLVMGVLLSVLLYIWRTGHPNIAVVGRLPHSTEFRSVARHQVETWPEILLVRVDENLYFANVGNVQDMITREFEQRPGIKHLVLVMSGVGFVDSSALRTLQAAAENLRAAGVTVHLADVKGPVMDRLRRTRIFEQLAPGQVFPTAQVAVTALSRAAEREKELIPL
ncbi:sulfate permease [Thioalkalivibrio sp. XN8]|uniref:SulP family inorganic anion transporter n=1 Tax=Thioalkalivibrio sp. XN8 TaxID=2712863 RepID=UPI0013ED2D30|nr:sulfate permease [Thioalkalivibrio sp. XN8]NGP52209.1 sulfate permease [Thioalkalivibrio sp. XN8]